MQLLRNIIENDNDDENLLNISRKIAKKRIIVKRPFYAKSLSKEQLEFSISNKQNRFDIYLPYK